MNDTHQFRLYVRADWMQHANCKNQTDTMYPEQGANSTTARNLCNNCPVQLRCLEYAIDNNENTYGMFGGKTPRERRQIAHNRRQMGWTTGRNRNKTA